MIKQIFGEYVGIYTLPNAKSYNEDLIKYAYFADSLTTQFKEHIESCKTQEEKISRLALSEQIMRRAHFLPEFPTLWFDDVMWALNEYVKGLGDQMYQRSFPFSAPYISSSWSNLIPPGKNIKSHDHSRFNARFSVAYYPKFLNNQGDLYIENTKLATNEKMYPHKDFPLREKIECKESRLVIFPGYVWHHTEHNKSNEDRINISCDIKYLGIDMDVPPVHLVEELTSALQQTIKQTFKFHYERKMDN